MSYHAAYLARMRKAETVWQVTNRNRFCAGVVVRNKRVILAAPILEWAIGSQFSSFKAGCLERNWKVVRA